MENDHSMETFKKACRGMLIMGISMAAAFPVQAFESTWLIDGTVAGLVGRDPDLAEEGTESGGANIALYITPIMGWKGSNIFLSPSLDINYSSAAQPLEVDNDAFLFSQQVSAQLELGGTWKPNKDTRITSKALVESFIGQVTKDEVWGKGLYDYTDGGAYVQWTSKWNTGWPSKSTLGTQFTNRIYPNFVALDNSGIKEKDAGIFKVYLEYDFVWPTDMVILTEFDYTVQAMGFKELHITDESGTLMKADGTPTDLRADTIHNFSLGVPMEKNRHSFNFIYEIEARDSNLAEFDSQAFLYIPDFHDYVEHAFTVGYGYEIPQFWFFDGPNISLQLTGLARLYITRPAKDDTGAYKAEAQRDRQTQFNLQFSSPITEHWGIFWNVNDTTYKSNNDDTGSAINNYKFVTTSLGAQFSY